MLDDGRNALFEGNLEDYARLATAGFPNVLYLSTFTLQSQKSAELRSDSVANQSQAHHTQATKTDSAVSSKTSKNEQRKWQRQSQELEQKIEALNQDIKNIEISMQEYASDFVKLHTLQQQYDTCKNQCAQYEEEWRLH